MNKQFSLGQCLVQKYGLSQEDADTFVEILFQIIRDRLEVDKIVKIKGLGTFKLAEMNARESVDINTRERIIIEGRQKLTFTPESAVRDRINSPFAQFETVEISDDADFTAIDEKYSEKELEAVDTAENDVPAIINDEQEDVKDESVPELNDTDSIATDDEAMPIEVVEDSEEKEREEAVVEQNANEEDSETSDSEVKDEVVSDSEAPKTDIEQTVAPDKDNFGNPIVRTPYCEDLIHESISHGRTIIRLLYGLMILVGVVLIMVGGYFCYQLGVREALIANNSPQGVVENVQQSTESEPEVVPQEEQPVVKPEVVDTIQPTAISPAESPAPSSAPAQPTAEELRQAEYNKDIRVRTGAYRIVGLDTTIVVSAGQTLKGISTAYLGAGMECYIEVFNGGITQVKPGDKIKIPKLRLKKKRV